MVLTELAPLVFRKLKQHNGASSIVTIKNLKLMTLDFKSPA